MRGITYKVDKAKGVLAIEVDLKGKGEISSTGKSLTIASSEGNVSIEHEGIKFGLNVYRPNSAYTKPKQPVGLDAATLEKARMILEEQAKLDAAETT